MSRRHVSVLVALGLILIAASAVALLPSAKAQEGESGLDFIAIDTDTQADPANTATSFGTVQACAEVALDGTVNVDIVVNAIPEDRPLAGFQMTVIYNAGIVNVIGLDTNFLLATGGDYRPVAFLSDPTPDRDGRFTIAVVDFGGVFETGPGTLARVTFQPRLAGVTSLTFDEELLIIDDQNTPLPIERRGSGLLAVETACAAAEGTPVATVEGATPQGTPYSGPEPPPGTQPTVPAEELTPRVDFTPPPFDEPTQPSADGAGGNDDGGSDDDDDGFPVWAVALIAVAAVATVGGGLYLRRLLARRSRP